MALPAGAPNDAPTDHLKSPVSTTSLTGDVKLEASTPGAEEKNRGRRRSRVQHEADELEDDEGLSPEGDGGVEGPSRKRRRSRKGLDKKFACPQEGCGKSYSRAEHLYRHQLNHSPKKIYNCDFPECTRAFVRQDLCLRHRERHTARGSQLQRREAFLQSIATPSSVKSETKVPMGIGAGQPNAGSMRDRDPTLAHVKTQPLHHSPPDKRSASVATASSASTVSAGSSAANLHHVVGGAGAPVSGLKRSNSDGGYIGQDDKRFLDQSTTPRGKPPSGFDHPHRHAGSGSIDSSMSQMPQHLGGKAFARPPPLQVSMAVPGLQTSSLPSARPMVATTPQAVGPAQVNAGGYATPQSPFAPQQTFAPLNLPPPGFPTMNSAASPLGSEGAFVTPPAGLSSVEQLPGLSGPAMQAGVSDSMQFDQFNGPYSVPVFGGDGGYSGSPYAMAVDFAEWLFNDPQMSSFGPVGRPVGSFGMPGSDGFGVPYQSTYGANDFTVADLYAAGIAPQHHPMAVTSILDTSPPESVLSEEKRQQLLELIEVRFNEANDAPVAKQKAALLEGNRDGDTHVLSLRMLQTYISSYWFHFHPQLPILHRPTFVADKTPMLLLVAIIAIGGSCLEKAHGLTVTQASAELSNFLAWHLRWEIFSDAHFRPPAKLWVFQALLLLEVYEKMYSNRALHERGHIHHATTITLMRRGSSLTGRPALESPPSVRDDGSSHGTNGSANTSGANTPERWWSSWITNEATRRAAFAAFVIDSTHATIFGHSAVMVAHEMQLPLPCDEALWSAPNGAEVARIEAGLNANGVKPIRFLDGLKHMIKGAKVRTNSFGRTILMAGLLSVSWHMNQRDLQVNSIGVWHALGGRDKWKGSLTRAFDHWKQDFDSSLAEAPEAFSGSSHLVRKVQRDIVFESKNVLHHLAHMAMHVDIVECQIFAGAPRLLGRSIGPQDYKSARQSMKERWAPTAKARDATFYALRFLSDVLLQENYDAHVMPTASLAEGQNEYSAREDYLMNRPWVLYFAALIVWSYGYALEGSLPAGQPIPTSPVQQRQDMRNFLLRVGGVRSPEDLEFTRGRNLCVGMLMVLRDMFKTTRWELLHEASNLLSNCVDMLTGSK